MQIAAANRDIQRSDDFKSNNFTINCGPKAFEILSSGIYSDKVGAVVREILCNAIDAHNMRGNKETIIINAPTRLEPTFSIRDFGPGMNEETVMTLYSSYFVSTKSNENVSIGGFGLGSKAPLCYVDAFTVTSWNGNKKKVYTVFKSEDGIPEIAKVHEIDSLEPSGVEVSLPVLSKDIATFHNSISQYTAYVADKVKVNGCDIGVPLYAKYPCVYNKGKYRLVKTPNYIDRIITIVMGGVPYRHELDDFNASNRDKFSASCHYIYFADIGEFEVAVSREKLAINSKSSNQIINIIDEFYSLVSEEINRTLAIAKTYREAYNLVKKFSDVFKHKFVIYWNKLLIETSRNWCDNYTLNKDNIHYFNNRLNASKFKVIKSSYPGSIYFKDNHVEISVLHYSNTTLINKKFQKAFENISKNNVVIGYKHDGTPPVDTDIFTDEFLAYKDHAYNITYVDLDAIQLVKDKKPTKSLYKQVYVEVPNYYSDAIEYEKFTLDESMLGKGIKIALFYATKKEEIQNICKVKSLNIFGYAVAFTRSKVVYQSLIKDTVNFEPGEKVVRDIYYDIQNKLSQVAKTTTTVFRVHPNILKYVEEKYLDRPSFLDIKLLMWENPPLIDVSIIDNFLHSMQHSTEDNNRPSILISSKYEDALVRIFLNNNKGLDKSVAYDLVKSLDKYGIETKYILGYLQSIGIDLQ